VTPACCSALPLAVTLRRTSQLLTLHFAPCACFCWRVLAFTLDAQRSLRRACLRKHVLAPPPPRARAPRDASAGSFAQLDHGVSVVGYGIGVPPGPSSTCSKIMYQSPCEKESGCFWCQLDKYLTPPNSPIANCTSVLNRVLLQVHLHLPEQALP
jgi:hypothetical protein